MNKWPDCTHGGHLRSLSTVGQGRRNSRIVASEMGPTKQICDFVENLSYNFFLLNFISLGRESPKLNIVMF
jgi:hypothetical protein